MTEVSVLAFLLAIVSTVLGDNPYVNETNKALEWLLQQRHKDWGWGVYDTPQALLALQLTDTGSPLERQLSAKQMEIDLVLQLWRNRESPALTPASMALYSMALTSICQDPRQFHGHDLIGSILHHEPESDREFTLCALAVCNAGAHIRKKPLRRLLNIANSKHTVDSLAGVVLAVQCIMKVHKNRNMQHYLEKPTLALARLQEADGGFGSLHGTAFALQALQEESESWNRSAAVAWLLSHQNPDGAFFDVPTTAEVVLALTRKSLMSVSEVDCDSPSQEVEPLAAAIIPHLKVIHTPKKVKPAVSTNTVVPMTTIEEDKKDGVSVTYTLWVGSNVTENHTISIVVQYNSTFYHVMQLAAQKDPHYAFSANEWPNGHYVHTLAGFKEQPMSYHYWLLYRLPSLPDLNNPPGNQLVAPTGVDDLVVQDNEHYLFWYKKL
ncbi:uncharacterized protein CG3556 [Macrosteles quadrilineatus]|uniref:uncharacterized protein CG3556 n=1 Tax=Macrosteles quadrilineatus TaxID=74068 RepID=UPI0023E0FC17|nr:uncharacterized protein CG3556 [Macrosteles quadrilineatus]